MLLRNVSSRLFFHRASLKHFPTTYSIKLMSTKNTMRAVFINEHGAADKLIYKEDVPVPQVNSDSVLIKNHFVGINYIDTYHRTGLYKVPLPYTLGREGAGEVVEVGSNVKDLKVGDRVVYLSGSTYAEYTNVDAANVQTLTNDISYEEAAAIGIQGLTAWTMLRDGYPVKKGDIILVHAAAGGVGLLLCQMAHHLGATVIGTVSSEEKAELARQNGATHTIIYTREDVVKRVNEITNNLGCHAVLDGVGKDTFESSLAVTRRLGTLISFGNATGVVPPISISCLAPKALKLMRPTLFAYVDTREEFVKWWSEILDLLRKKVIKLHIHKIYDLKDASQAHIDIESRRTTGKLLLKL
ncbi:putative quinone oxidoreductase [Choanephora cucurbitarum]|uniref:Probable quinone oxidoreductase n=1 Tax=Choanephora cucurbitarum TaxID=101091 RepID=A0A1C7NB01_9FUNG|nr:putative quinone oxidoreductase [Choanephora cucurbitarum]